MKRKIYWLDIFGTRHMYDTADESRYIVAFDDVCDKAKAARLSGYTKSEVL